MSSASLDTVSDDGAEPSADPLFDLLERLAEHEIAFGERLYALFFERCPEAAPLFGEHSISEREEMIRETIRCLDAWRSGEPWLTANLHAIGASHAEYGVEDWMYAPFVAATLDVACATLTPAPDEASLEIFEEGLCAIVSLMKEGVPED